MIRIEKAQTEQKELSAQSLAKEVAKATLAEVQGMFRRDLEILKAKLPAKDEVSAESALDMKYLRDRQANLRFS